MGRRVDAREQLAAALAIFDREGADGWSARTTQELAATGATVRSRADPSADALTAQERQVALLAAEGRTNREVGAALFTAAPGATEVVLDAPGRGAGSVCYTAWAVDTAARPSRAFTTAALVV